MTPAESQIRVAVDESGAVVVAGEVDVASFDELSEKIRTALEGPAPGLVLDLAGVDFMDSSGLRLLLECKDVCTTRDVAFVVRAPSAVVRRLLDITGLTSELDIS